MKLQGLRVMGIDPGLTRCGLSVVQAGAGRSVLPVAVGVVRTPPEEVLEKRLQRLYDAVDTWIRDYSPDVVAIERLFERGNVSTVIHTAHAVGVLMLAAVNHGLDVHHYTPSEVKKAISGNGRADKKQMTTMITRILGLSEAPKPADAADALALAVCHCWRAPLIARTQSLGNVEHQRRVATGRLAQLKAAHEKSQGRARPQFPRRSGSSINP